MVPYWLSGYFSISKNIFPLPEAFTVFYYIGRIVLNTNTNDFDYSEVLFHIPYPFNPTSLAPLHFLNIQLY